MLRHHSVSVGGDGLTFLGCLGIAFTVLKLLGFIDWSWWAVLVPFYAFPLLVALVVLLLAVCWVICALLALFGRTF